MTHRAPCPDLANRRLDRACVFGRGAYSRFGLPKLWPGYALFYAWWASLCWVGSGQSSFNLRNCAIERHPAARASCSSASLRVRGMGIAITALSRALPLLGRPKFVTAMIGFLLSPRLIAAPEHSITNVGTAIELTSIIFVIFHYFRVLDDGDRAAWLDLRFPSYARLLARLLSCTCRRHNWGRAPCPVYFGRRFWQPPSHVQRGARTV